MPIFLSSGGGGTRAGLSDFLAVMAAVLEFFKIPFTIYGVTISLWQVLMFSALASVLIGFIARLINDE